MKRDVQAQGYYHSTVNGSLGRRPGLTTIPTPPAPEVVEKARRRTFSAEYNRFGKLTTGLRMLREAAACTASGEIGALLRREGLYSSHLTDWRRQHERGELEALSPKQRGRQALDLASAQLYWQRPWMTKGCRGNPCDCPIKRANFSEAPRRSRPRFAPTRDESSLPVRSIAELKKENARLTKRLEQAEMIIEVQKKASP